MTRDSDIAELAKADAAAERPAPETWFVRVDNWQPTRLNQLLSSHWGAAARMKRADANIVGWACKGAGVTEATTPRRVSLEITLAPRQRAADPDAYWKTLLDALVKCGALVDDSRLWVELGSVTYSRGARMATVLKIECLPALKPTREGFGKRKYRTGAYQRANKRTHRISI